MRHLRSTSLLQSVAVTGCLTSIFCFGQRAFAVTYSGRILTGAYASTERFSELSDGTQRNDFATISSRFYLHASDISKELFEFTSDFRDKNDFFDKLDSERLTLTSNNTLQLRQLNVRRNNDHFSVFGGFGRMPIPEAGAVNTDGLELGYRFPLGLRTGLFGGFNPQRTDQSAMQWNHDSTVYGAYGVFQPQSDNWRRYFYSSSALVGQKNVGHLDRMYYYNNTVYQWQAPNQILGLLYLDFVPKTNIQSAFISYDQEWTKRFSTTFNVSAIDTIEYSRRKGVLERLESSPYRELNTRFRQKLNDISVLYYSLIYGKRSSDSLSKVEVSVGPRFAHFLSRHFQGGVAAGYRKNFTSRDYFSRADIGYFSKDWESTLSGEFGSQKETGGDTYYPLVLEASVARYISRALYATLSFQDASTSRVTIYSTFFKIGYRFGSKNVPPLRDGAPPMGSL